MEEKVAARRARKVLAWLSSGGWMARSWSARDLSLREMVVVFGVGLGDRGVMINGLRATCGLGEGGGEGGATYSLIS